MFHKRFAQTLICWFLLALALVAGCQNIANMSADKFSGDLPPQSESQD